MDDLRILHKLKYHLIGLKNVSGAAPCTIISETMNTLQKYVCSSI